MPDRDPVPTEFVDARIDEWVRDGLITHDQALAIRELETHRREEQRLDSPAIDHAPFDDPDGGANAPGGIIREVLGYVGAVFVLIAGFVLVAQFWEDIPNAARIAISVAAGTLLAVTGMYLGSNRRASVRRAGRVSLLLAAAPIGFAVGMLADAVLADEDISVLSGFVGALGFSLFFYRRGPSFAQHLALFLSALGTTVAAGTILAGDEGSWVIGILIAALGAGWIVASTSGHLPPRVLAEVSGIVALGIGSLIAVGSFGSSGADGIAAMVFWILVSIGLVGLGVARDRVVFIIGGVLGMVIYIPWMIGETLGGGLGAPLALIVAGGILIATAIYLTRRADRT
jgi:hypothetical protein